jgi:hypothetical protein
LILTACGGLNNNTGGSQSTLVSDLAQTATALSATLAGNRLAETATAFSLQRTSLSQPSLTPEPPTGTPAAQPGTPAPTSALQNPQNIPLVPGEILNLFQSDNLITYTSPLIYDETVEFYESAMTQAGWQRIEMGSYVASSVAELIFRKDDREVQVLIRENPVSSQSYIVITIR